MCTCDNYDPPAFYAASVVRARKQHKCCECRTEIKIGEKHEKATGKWEGKIATYRTCLKCKELWQRVSSEVPDICMAHSALNDEIYNSELIVIDKQKIEVITVDWLQRSLNGRFELVAKEPELISS